MEDEILADVKPAVRIRLLRHDADPLPHADGVGADVHAAHDRPARRRADARRENADGGRLPRPVGSKQPEELPLRHIEVERLESDDLARRGGRLRPPGAPPRRRRCGIDLPQLLRVNGGRHARESSDQRRTSQRTSDFVTPVSRDRYHDSAACLMASGYVG